LTIIKKKLKDKNIIHLTKIILANYHGKNKGKGMPLGNLTSQFFANVYLNGLDQFVKHNLKATYYIRYVDDFVILHKGKSVLEQYKKEVSNFLRNNLSIELHPTKSKIIPLNNGVDFVGFRIFYHHKLLRKTNQKRLKNKPSLLKKQFDRKIITYDSVHDVMLGSFAYAKHANTYNLRKAIIKQLEILFPNEVTTTEINQHARTTT
jgi:RNA-directed DNA polymerase